MNFLFLDTVSGMMYHHKFSILFCILAFHINALKAVDVIDGSDIIKAGVDGNFNDSSGQKPSNLQRIVIDTSTSLHIISSRFLSIAIDSDQIRWKWRGFDFSSKKLQNLASGLSPINIRFGGTYADFLHFDPHGMETPLPEHWTREKQEMEHVFDSGFFENPFDLLDANFTMTGKQWDNMTSFCDTVGWDIMFDFNLFYWRNGLWNPSNADLLLRYSAARGVKIPAFQLGNEPNAYYHNFNFTIASDVLVKDFRILKQLISKYPQYDASGLYGPDVTDLSRHGSARQYLQGFLESGGCDAVTEVSLHHYYISAKVATVKDFLSPAILDALALELAYAHNITVGACKYHKPLRFTETSSCYGGGAPYLSDAYVAGFMWLDKLGLSAKYGVTHVFRQTFFAGSYALVDMKLNPNPDYFLSVLYKRLIEGPVFHVITAGRTPLLRLYAHCARQGYYNYPDGALVLYYLNLADDAVTFGLDQYQNSDLDLFLLTPGDSMGLKSRFVKLNGETLVMNGSELPHMPPRQHSGDVTVSAHSFGFLVIPSAEVHLCKLYHRTTARESH